MATRTSLLRTACRAHAAAPQSISRSAFVTAQWRRQNQAPRMFSVAAKVQEKKYTKDHEWIELGEDGKTYTLGITSYAASALGDVIYIELPSSGLEIGAGDAIGAVESVKSASDILTPVSGTVVATNEVLEEKPKVLNDSPEGDGWICRIEGDGTDVEGLMGVGEYKAFTEEEEAH
ncbi:glycine cleavage system H protein [Aulographum hederae CBS 113979]|uniref:Glycine cleavage system H protein n=1 Tax=Aulographum hederae CBS 113979 TaxID=1176131 RepID=A0A6G1HAN1_9PEZI|nr:glycine cleavage system H protein [Aulographum hederae CBS 113979]